MSMGYLKDGCYLKSLEEPHIYDATADELYLLDDDSFGRVMAFCEGNDDSEASSLLGEAGLLQDGPRKNPARVEGKSANPSLRYLEVQITGRCDKVCRHCYLGAPVKMDMEPETFSGILAELSGIQGLKVMVSGGEPACHPYFREMAQDLPNYPLRSVLVTHGEWIGADEARWLGRYFHQVQVSLDGLEPGHDALRGKGSFTRATAGIRALEKVGVPVSVGTMVHEENLDQFEEMSGLVRAMGAQEWDIDVPCTVGRWKPGTLEREQEPGLLKVMSEKLRYGFGGSFHGGSAGLACGSHLMTVAHDGTSAKCGFYLDTPAGNVREGLESVWERVRHVPLENIQCDCDQLDECAGGCRFRAEIMEGSDLAPDIVQCFARGIR
jgi:radical SAM protein with 4Fe4S-binding SPASM domain